MNMNNVKGFVNKVDVAIPDLTKETAKEETINIFSDVASAALYAVASNVCFANALMKAVPFGVKGVKTVIKKGVLKINDFYDNGQIVTVWK